MPQRGGGRFRPKTSISNWIEVWQSLSAKEKMPLLLLAVLLDLRDKKKPNRCSVVQKPDLG